MVFGPLILFAIIKTFFFSPFLVEGESMLPGIKSGEVFLVDRMTYTRADPKRDDVVVFFLDEDHSYFYVKRIIGLPGDNIHLEKDGVDVVVGGVRHRLLEPFLMPDPHPSEHFLSDGNELGQDFTVPASRYFMMGDNREHSRDSRYFKDPFVPRGNLVGKFGVGLGNVDDLEKFWADDQPQQLPLRKLDILRGRAPPENPKNQQQKAIANFNVQVADSADEREKGLMFRTQMSLSEGMVFLFDTEKPLTFWMKNTLIPLDIIYIDKDWQVLSIQKMAQPCKKYPCGLYPSVGPAKYVLEINSGLSDKLGIAPGQLAQLQ